MYKCINNLIPADLCNLFVPRTPNYDFRKVKKKLMLPKPRIDYLRRSFSYNGAILWNNLFEVISKSNSLGFFKGQINATKFGQFFFSRKTFLKKSVASTGSRINS